MAATVRRTYAVEKLWENDKNLARSFRLIRVKLLEENSAYKLGNKETSSEQFLLSFNIDNSDILRYVESFL